MYRHSISVRNVNEALPLGLQLVKQHGVKRVSRGLATLEVPGPVCTVYRNPHECVLFDPVRDANPFFHLFESIWILAGSNAVDVPAVFLPRIKDYSDDGRTFFGAYGYRLRHQFGYDQIEAAISKLALQPDTRQVVLSIWDARTDLKASSKDFPCNDTITFKIRDGSLDMTVFNRSNDVIWGAYGANAVQFSVLMQYVAARLGVRVGHYTQVSDSYHVYEDNALWQKYVSGEYRPPLWNEEHYYADQLPNLLFKSNEDAFLAFEDARGFCNLVEQAGPRAPLGGAVRMEFKSHLVKNVALPLYAAWNNHKAGDTHSAISLINAFCQQSDWRRAAVWWLARRLPKDAV